METAESLEKKVAEGRQLVVLNNLILDVETKPLGYADFHPGGKFVMTKNFGRDISKFFYGGYSMIGGENIHNHSAKALQIAK